MIGKNYFESEGISKMGEIWKGLNKYVIFGR